MTYDDARALVDAMDFTAAAPALAVLTNREPSDARAWALRGWVALVQGKKANARRWLDRAIELGLDNNARVLIQRATIDNDDLELAERAVKLAPKDTGVLFAAAEIADLCDESGRAVELIRRFVKLAPKEGGGYTRLAAYAWNARQVAVAKRAVKTARRLGQREPFFDTISAA